MAKTYSVYEAKAKMGEIVRRARSGMRTLISYRGEPVAEVVPWKPQEKTIDERLREMELQGEIVPAKDPSAKWHVGKSRPGALERFLKERE